MLQGCSLNAYPTSNQLHAAVTSQKVTRPTGSRASRMRVNSHDVARAANVSASAVSRAFTPGASVAPEKRARILAAARELGYRPNVMARAIAKGRSNVVGMIMFGETNRHHPEVLLAISRSFQTRGIRVMLFIIEHTAEIEDVVENVLSYQLDGVIAAAPIPAADMATLEQAEVPVIFYNRPGVLNCASVSCDHAGAGRAVAAHLLAAGHRNFALIHAQDSYVASERMRGVETELAGAKAKVVAVSVGDFAYDEGFEAVSNWLSKGKAGFTALIAANDMMAIGALDALVASGRKMESEIAVAGFDGIDASRWQSHRIISVRQPIEQMAEAVAEMILKQMDVAIPVAEYRVFPGQLQPATSPQQAAGKKQGDARPTNGRSHEAKTPST